METRHKFDFDVAEDGKVILGVHSEWYRAEDVEALQSRLVEVTRERNEYFEAAQNQALDLARAFADRTIELNQARQELAGAYDRAIEACKAQRWRGPLSQLEGAIDAIYALKTHKGEAGG